MSANKTTNSVGSIAVKQSLRAAKMVGDVDPVIGLDVAVVVLDPLGPRERPLLEPWLEQFRGVRRVILVQSPLRRRTTCLARTRARSHDSNVMATDWSFPAAPRRNPVAACRQYFRATPHIS